MKNIKLGDQVYEGVETVRLDTAEGGTVDFAPYQETFAAGRVEGYNAGKEAGLEEGFDNGKQAGIQSEYDRFWDAYQQNGQRSNYDYAFVNPGWNDETFKPKYDIVFGNAYCRNAFWQCKITDLAGILRKQNVSLDTSGAQYMANIVGGSAVTRVPAISTLGAAATGANSLFSYCGQLVEVEKLILPDSGAVIIANSFDQCSKLTTITFEGVIGHDINFQWSPLSVDSMKSVITHLKNYGGTADAGTKTVKFTDACWTALEADGTAPDGNTWRDYVETTLGWLT